jgi:hypothetical protein
LGSSLTISGIRVATMLVEKLKWWALTSSSARHCLLRASPILSASRQRQARGLGKSQSKGAAPEIGHAKRPTPAGNVREYQSLLRF